MIRVVSRRTAGAVPPNVVRIYIGRPSPLGNPFPLHGESSRQEVIAQYETWLAHARMTNKAVADELARVAALAAKGHEVELECWCAPQACHGDVVKRTVEAWIEHQSQVAAS